MSHCLPSSPPKPAAPTFQIAASSKQTQLIIGPLLAVGSPCFSRTAVIPLYYAWIGAYVLLAAFGRHYLVAHVGTVEGIDISILAQVLFLQNFRDLLGRTVSFWWFTATWSLAVEEQFYLVSPLFVRYLSKRALAWFLILVTLAAPVLRLVARDSFHSGTWLAY